MNFDVDNLYMYIRAKYMKLYIQFTISQKEEVPIFSIVYPIYVYDCAAGFKSFGSMQLPTCGRI